MSKRGRMICKVCKGEFPYTRENIKKMSSKRGFICDRCEGKSAYKSRKKNRTIFVEKR